MKPLGGTRDNMPGNIGPRPAESNQTPLGWLVVLKQN
jgi:hypothetical protein